MDEINYSFEQTGKLSILDLKPNYNISFHNNGQEIGKLDFNGPKMVFTGDAEESAKVFIDWVARSFHGRLEEERKAEQEACAKEFDRRAVYVDGSPSSGWYEPDEPARIIRARGNT